MWVCVRVYFMCGRIALIDVKSSFCVSACAYRDDDDFRIFFCRRSGCKEEALSLPRWRAGLSHLHTFLVEVRDRCRNVCIRVRVWPFVGAGMRVDYLRIGVMYSKQDFIDFHSAGKIFI